MPTVPLVLAASEPDGWHDVRSPGGYEWWYFDAEDAASDTQIVAIFLDGFVFHPGYLRRHFAYLRRPTRHAPAVASDFPCAYFVIYERGRIAAQFMTQYPPGSLRASSSEVSVDLGPNRLRRDPAGDYQLHLEGTPWRLTPRGPQTLHGQTLSVDWTLKPVSKHPAEERRFLSAAMTGAEHHWVLAAPHCTFNAAVRLTGIGEDRTWQLTGRAYHDHNYGTAPLGPGLKHWIWGRALFNDACYTFHYAVGKDPALPPEPHLVRITPDGGVVDVSDRVPPGAARFDRRSPVWVGYPSSLDLGPLRLASPRIIDSAPFYMRLVYQAECEGRTGTAFCEVALPERLRWPVLGRMIEMSFDRRTAAT